MELQDETKWRELRFTSLVMKARMLRLCRSSFHRLHIANANLNSLNTVDDVVRHLQALNEKPVKLPVFMSLDLQNLPENLTIEV
ncbi:hypothetical protein SARC_04976 [Sphaeroforma arctica JP610]|uniref:Uncharacterized protein n=1 Tax=Sphaeroforma arctica JP610 TaxID=667725 RepID=A0A0L0G1L8_9EUKA|nr:hypothetical protein SARC_04976 [Sphaeroforma arctica JP610]KNC82734.1 hypothetical protein SARC_04976 [Sphaeroforma arctica JP610]|eukprot:XP_014156636.1 hypothetical protein SARC_04976 [Sphaeroforma arctica JP610]